MGQGSSRDHETKADIDGDAVTSALARCSRCENGLEVCLKAAEDDGKQIQFVGLPPRFRGVLINHTDQVLRVQWLFNRFISIEDEGGNRVPILSGPSLLMDLENYLQSPPLEIPPHGEVITEELPWSTRPQLTQLGWSYDRIPAGKTYRARLHIASPPMFYCLQVPVHSEGEIWRGYVISNPTSFIT